MRFTAFQETRLNPATRFIEDLEGSRSLGGSGGTGVIGDISRNMH
jgi:hypothetical protein